MAYIPTTNSQFHSSYCSILVELLIGRTPNVVWYPNEMSLSPLVMNNAMRSFTANDNIRSVTVIPKSHVFNVYKTT